MTPVNSLQVDFKEIGNIRITCANCSTEIAIPIERETPKYLECPGCNKHFWGDGHQAKVYAHVQNIAAVLRHWRQADIPDFSLTFSLPQK